MTLFTKWREDLHSFTDEMIQRVQKKTEDSIYEQIHDIRRVIRTVDGIIDTAEKVKSFVRDPESVIRTWINQQVEEIKSDLRSLVPTPQKVHATSEELRNIVVAAAERGLDIVIELNRSVAFALDQVKAMAQVAGKAISNWLQEVHDEFWARVGKVKGSIGPVLPDDLRRFIDSVDPFLRQISAELAESLQEKVHKATNEITGFVDKTRKVFTDIREFLVQIWNVLFGGEPEQFQIAAQWFQARMERLENEQLFKRSEPIPSVLIRKQKDLGVLPANETIWRSAVQEYIKLQRNPDLQARLRHELACADPKPGSLLQISVEEPHTDELGGCQRTTVSVLYYRWHSDAFRRISAGYLGVVYMVCAMSTQGVKYQVPPVVSNSGGVLATGEEDLPLLFDEMKDQEMARFAHDWTHIGKIKDLDGSWVTR